ncbi:TPA: PD-(D/E)XK nuclease family protein, partial [Pseudomonas aeruginosa]|nr:PD-(D/E)XK nuclease family protein [Pseudomonas aeruginosa]
CREIVVEPAPEADAERYVAGRGQGLGQARETRRSSREKWWVASYSGLQLQASAGLDDDEVLESDESQEPISAEEATFHEEGRSAEQPPVAHASEMRDDLHRFPRGPAPGTFLHGLLEWAGREGFEVARADAQRRRELVARRCDLRGWKDWAEPLDLWLEQYLAEPLRWPGGETSLAGLVAYQVEMEFWFATHQVQAEAIDALVRRHTLGGAARPALAPTLLNGMFKGFVDLVFEHQGRFYVADYKSNWLGADDGAYSPEAMTAAVLENRYDLQYVLYLLALHRQLKARLPDYDYDRHMGGAVYLFLRGARAATQGLHFERPPRELIERLDALFSGQPGAER